MPNEPPVQVRATSEGSELGRQVAVDLEADADLDEGRGGPGHWSLSPGAYWNCDKGRTTWGWAQAWKRRGRDAARCRAAQFARDIRKRKTGPFRVRVAVCRRAGRQSPSRGEQLTVRRLRSGRMSNRLAASEIGMAEPNFPDNTKGRMPAMRRSQRGFSLPARRHWW